MSSLLQNINQAISDFGAIKTAIENKGVNVPSGTPTSQYPAKISSIQTGITPSGTVNITSNGTVDVTGYASANVNVVSQESELLRMMIENSTQGFDLTIPSGITIIRDHAFQGRGNLRSVIIPDTVTIIGAYAFSEAGLISHTAENPLVIPDNVEYIGMQAFESSRFEAIIIPTSMRIIEEFAFAGCDRLTDIYYKGTQEQWEQIQGLSSAEIPSETTIHYNYTT